MSNRIVSNSTFAVNSDLEQVVEVSGDVNITTTNPLNMNLQEVNGSTISLGQTSSIDCLPVVLASNDTPNMNVSNFGGVAISQGQNTMSSSMPVAIASDQSSLTVSTTAGSDLLVDLNKVGGVGYGLGENSASNSIPVVLANDVSGDINLAEVGDSAITLGSTTESNCIPVVIASDQSSIPVSVSNSDNSGSEGNLNNATSVVAGDFSSQVDTTAARNITITGNTNDTGFNSIEIHTSHTSAGTKYKFSYDIYPDSNGDFFERIENVAVNYIYLKYTASATVTATALFN